METNTLLLLGSSFSYMINSIKKQLESNGFSVVFSLGEVDEINKFDQTYQGILIYADEQIADAQKMLVYLKDLATESDIPIFLMGYDEEMAAIGRVIPKHLIADVFPRPINVSQLGAAIEQYFKSHSVGEKPKILVVDDSGSALRMIKGWLDQKYQVILASSGMMAIKFLTQDNPDLVLLDYEMPVCDGKQVLQMIRSESDYSDVPVIFLTSKSDRQSIIDVMSLRPEGYLLKTMEPEDIVKSIDEFFEKRKGRFS